MNMLDKNKRYAQCTYLHLLIRWEYLPLGAIKGVIKIKRGQSFVNSKRKITKYYRSKSIKDLDDPGNVHVSSVHICTGNNTDSSLYCYKE